MADFAAQPTDPNRPATTPWPVIAVAWIVVGVPLAWGVSQTARQASALFGSSPAAAATQPATAPVTR